MRAYARACESPRHYRTGDGSAQEEGGGPKNDPPPRSGVFAAELSGCYFTLTVRLKAVVVATQAGGMALVDALNR